MQFMIHIEWEEHIQTNIHTRDEYKLHCEGGGGVKTTAFFIGKNELQYASIQ